MSIRLFPSVIAIGVAAGTFTACSSDSTRSEPGDGSADARSPTPDAAADTAAPADGSADAGPVCAPSFAGCTSFEDRTADGADRKVSFKDFQYTPKCLRMKVGQTVTFVGDFDRHPLVSACGPSLAMDKRTGSGSAGFMLTAPGIYGYYCLDHGNPAGAVMAGGIDVVP